MKTTDYTGKEVQDVLLTVTSLAPFVGKMSKAVKKLKSIQKTPDDSYIYTGSFECPSCDKKNTFPSELQEHIETSHDQSWSYFTLLPTASSTWKYVPCNVCDMHFDNEAKLM